MAAATDYSWKQKLWASVEVPVLTRCCFCFPLRRGLLVFAYINMVLGLVVGAYLWSAVAVSSVRESEPTSGAGSGEAGETTSGATSGAELARLIADASAIMLETIMNIVFIVALHRKHALMMKVYLYFEIVFSLVGLVYSMAFLSSETADELFFILFESMTQLYLVILIWSSVVKMERDGSVKYTRDTQVV